jgi:hypothetical protein
MRGAVSRDARQWTPRVVDDPRYDEPVTAGVMPSFAPWRPHRASSGVATGGRHPAT